MDTQQKQHYFGVTISEPNHTAVSMRKEKSFKKIKVTSNNQEDATRRAKAYYTKRGYRVHDVELLKIEESVVSADAGITDIRQKNLTGRHRIVASYVPVNTPFKKHDELKQSKSLSVAAGSQKEAEEKIKKYYKGKGYLVIGTQYVGPIDESKEVSMVIKSIRSLDRSLGSLALQFSEEESNKLYKILSNKAKNNKEINDFIASGEDESGDYSNTVLRISTQNIVFGLYSAGGRLRIQGDGENSSIKTIKSMFKFADFVNALNSFGSKMNEEASTDNGFSVDVNDQEIVPSGEKYGFPYFDLDPETYATVIKGKKDKAHWAKFLGDSNIGKSLSKFARNGKFMLRNNKTGEMSFAHSKWGM